jgi:hypothetical protein
LHRAEALANTAKFAATVSLNAVFKADSEDDVTDWHHRHFLGGTERWTMAARREANNTRTQMSFASKKARLPQFVSAVEKIPQRGAKFKGPFEPNPLLTHQTTGTAQRRAGMSHSKGISA